MKTTSPLIVLASLLAPFVGSSVGALYFQDFTAPDGTTGSGLGDGSFIASNQPGNPGTVQGNQLVLTDALVGDTRSSFRIPAVANSSLGWIATFDFTLADIAGGNPPADGFSFNYGAIPDFNPAQGDLAAPDSHGQGEEGWGAVEHISFEIDTWMVGDAEHGFNIAGNVGGVQQDFAFLNTDVITDGQSISGTAVFSWDPINGASMSSDLTGPIFTNVPTGTFTGNDDYVFAFGARTGGATEDVFIDNLSISTIPEPGALALLALGALPFLRRRR
ncbi:hypothetical protein BH23VER1_BH23VER1_34910 [soil metagenome]